ncbi:hypothetical protein ACFW9O_25025 [Streptomyces sp. NPDC059499]|uniref:hypothetical protein n=1 Tax=Streptomyces sp. NPDC059499 TaxID=3346852 RepID=UPI0036A98527
MDIKVDSSSMGSITVGGTDISKGVSAITWRSSLDEYPSMELELRVFDVTTLSSEDTEILIPEETAQALIAIGWTPPDATSAETT